MLTWSYSQGWFPPLMSMTLSVRSILKMGFEAFQWMLCIRVEKVVVAMWSRVKTIKAVYLWIWDGQPIASRKAFNFIFGVVSCHSPEKGKTIFKLHIFIVRMYSKEVSMKIWNAVRPLLGRPFDSYMLPNNTPSFSNNSVIVRPLD